MAAFIERMKEEHKELTIKIDALNAFIFSNAQYILLSDIEQVNMVKQLAHMQAYAAILNVRIWSAKPEE